MKSVRALVPALAVVASLVAAIPPASALPGEDAPQTLFFTTEAPVGATWGRFPYFVEAKSTTGADAFISVDPSSTGCTGPAPGEAERGMVAVSFPRPGSCIIHADEPGGVGLAPAPQITQAFEVGRLNSYVTTTKASKGLVGLTPTTFRAELDVDTFFGPGTIISGYRDAAITFAIAGRTMCSAKTVVVPSDNPFVVKVLATCKATIGLGNALRSSYTASFAGDDLYLPDSATGKLV